MVSYCTSRSRSARRSRVETCSSSRARRTRVRSPRATRSRTAETSAEKTSSSRASAHSTSSMPSSRPACRRSSAPTPSSSDEYGTGGVTRLFTTSLSTPARRPSSRRRTSSGRRTPRSANSLRSIFLNALCTSFATCSRVHGKARLFHVAADDLVELAGGDQDLHMVGPPGGERLDGVPQRRAEAFAVRERLRDCGSARQQPEGEQLLQRVEEVLPWLLPVELDRPEQAAGTLEGDLHRQLTGEPQGQLPILVRGARRGEVVDEAPEPAVREPVRRRWHLPFRHLCAFLRGDFPPHARHELRRERLQPPMYAHPQRPGPVARVHAQLGRGGQAEPLQPLPEPGLDGGQGAGRPACGLHQGRGGLDGDRDQQGRGHAGDAHCLTPCSCGAPSSGGSSTEDRSRSLWASTATEGSHGAVSRRTNRRRSSGTTMTAPGSAVVRASICSRRRRRRS